ncbi:hypothetical protein DRN86_05780 [Candidatus Geothermarchaeota archaeon]|nr:MAG: hypothetical protein DRN86_05780 [Candidatus Geothermarchaeota archaeon]
MIPLRGLGLALLICFLFQVAAYHKYSQDKFIEGDGYCYLNLALSFYSWLKTGTGHWFDIVRSPLLGIFIPPDLELARFAMNFYLLLTVAILYAISYKLTRNALASSLAVMSYGTIVYLLDFTRKVMSDLPAVMLFLLAFYFYLSRSQRGSLLFASFGALAFTLRPDTAILLLPLFLLSFKRNRKMFFHSFSVFVLIALVGEFALEVVYFGQPNYSPFNFFFTNLLTEDFKVTRVEDASLLWYVENSILTEPLFFSISLISLFLLLKEKRWDILSVFLLLTLSFALAPKIDPRVYMVKVFSILTPALSFLYRKLLALNELPAISLTILILFSHLNGLLQLTYPHWDPKEAITFVLASTPKNTTICSNIIPVVTYYAKRDSKLVTFSLKQVEAFDYTTTEEYQLIEVELKERGCGLLLYLTHPAITNDREDLVIWLKRRYQFDVLSSGDYPTLVFYLKSSPIEKSI